MSRTLLAISAVVLASGGCKSSKKKAASESARDGAPQADAARVSPPTPVERSVATYERFTAALAAGDRAALASLFADNATFQTGNNPAVKTGGAAIAELLGGFSASFPDMVHDTHLLLANDRWLASVTSARGTNTVAMGPTPATNKRTSFRQLTLFKLDGEGRVIAAVAHADNLNFLGHMGMWKGEARPVDDSKTPARIDVSGKPASPGVTSLATKLGAAIAARDAAAIAALYGADAVLDDLSETGPRTGKQAVADYWNAQLEQFPDLTRRDVEIVGAGDYAVISYKFAATNSGDLSRFGVKATGKPLSLICADVIRVGKEAGNHVIDRHDIFMDGMSVGMMLGVLSL